MICEGTSFHIHFELLFCLVAGSRELSKDWAKFCTSGTPALASVLVFTIAVIKHYVQDNLQKKQFILVHGFGRLRVLSSRTAALCMRQKQEEEHSHAAIRELSLGMAWGFTPVHALYDVLLPSRQHALDLLKLHHQP